MNEQAFAGFWIRTGATIIDTILMLIIILPILTAIYGEEYWSLASESMALGFWDIFFSYILPMIAVIVFWVFKSATPGKMATKLKIVDAKTGNKLSLNQAIGRYFAYIPAMLPLGLGLIWVGIDKKKQGWHDKLAGTAVIRTN
ncbi:MAG: RDD family protein [Thiotrichaceae bacterium]